MELALFTTSITGTAAMESAMLSKKGVILGNPWFLSCPGVHQCNDFETFDDFMSKISLSSQNLSEIIKWLDDFIKKNNFFINQSQ